MPAITSPLNTNLNNILNYSPPQYVNKNNVTKSTSSITSSNPNNNSNNSSSSTSNTGNNNGISGNRPASISYGSSLLCYQNVSPPSPTISIVHGNSNSDEKKIEDLTLKADGTTTAGTLAGLTIGDTSTLTMVIKKRNKLRHRFSDVGSWGRKKKEQTHKYRSMNIESLEVLGDPVIEDEFFVSIYILFNFL